MQTERPTVSFTYEDYLLIPEDGKRHELIDGEEYVSPAPKTRHQRIVFRLSGFLFAYLRRTGRGEALAAPVDVLFSETDVVQPDVLFISSERLGMIQEHGVVGAPDLVVEVLSEGSRRHDEVRKRKLYERYGIQEYWIVDPELETLKVYRMTASGYVRQDELSREGGATLSSPLLPGFDLSLEELFTGSR